MFATPAPPASIQGLYVEHHGWLQAWLRKKLGCAATAQDLAQDTFVRVLLRPQAALAALEPRAWLSTVAKGLVVDRQRRAALASAYAQALAALPEAQHPGPEEGLQLIEALARIDALLDGLKPRTRQAFLLSRLEGLSHAEIARQLQVSLSTVEKDMATALRHCLALRSSL